MTALSITAFSGMIPRTPSDKLPDGASEYAENCDFSRSDLRSLRGLGTKYSVSNPVRSLFTPDGTYYFTWPFPTRAYLSPTIDDTWGRVYYNTEGAGVRVAQRSTMKRYDNNPVAPTVSYKVGVSPPTSSETASVLGLDHSEVYAQSVSSTGDVVAEVPVTSITTVVYWKTYRVSIPSGFLGNVSSTQATHGVVPDNNGYAAGPLPLSYQYDMGLGVQARNVGANQWAINSSGVVFDNTLGSGTPVSNVVSCTYAGIDYSDPSKLFAVLTGGSSAVTTAATTTLQFRAKITFPDTGAVFYDGVIPFAPDPSYSGQYLLTVPDSVSGQSRMVACCATVVNVLGEESAPCDPVLVTWQDNGTNAISFSISYTPNPDEFGISGVNFYRTYPGNGNAASYFLVNASPITLSSGSASLVDKSTAPTTATALATATWSPPVDFLSFLAYAGNGFFAAAIGKDLYFSEPYHPHAWPYAMMFPHEITGIIEAEGGLLVATKTQAYLVAGAHPAQMSQQVLNNALTAVGWRAMAALGRGVAYASNDGIVLMSGGSASTEASRKLFSRELWRSDFREHFSSLVFSAWDNRLLCLIDDYTLGNQAFILNLEDGAESNTVFNPGSPYLMLGAGISATTAQVGILFDSGFAEFGVGDLLGLVWKSKVYEYPRPVFFAAMIIRYTGAFIFSVYADDVLVYTHAWWTCSDAETRSDLESYYTSQEIRLPPVGSHKRWQIQVVGVGIVSRIELGSSYGELRNV